MPSHSERVRRNYTPVVTPDLDDIRERYIDPAVKALRDRNDAADKMYVDLAMHAWWDKHDEAYKKLLDKSK